MTTMFDVERFISMPTRELGSYLDTLPDGPFGRPTPASLMRLIGMLDELGEVHAIYVVVWAVEAGVPTIADEIVRLVRRMTDRGGQYTLLRCLGLARDLAQHHIDEVDAIHTASPHFILEGGIEELKAAWTKSRSDTGKT